MQPSPHKVMDSLHSRVMVNKIMAHMPNLLLQTEVTRRQHLQLAATPSSNNSMDPPMLSLQQLAILLPSLPLIATPSQPRVMEPVVMTVLLLLLLQLPPSLMALSQGILPSLPTLVMASRLLPLHHRVIMLTASRLVTIKAATRNQQHMPNNNLATKPSRRAMANSRGTSSRPSSNNRLPLLTLLRLLVPMGRLQPTSTASKVDLPVTTSPTITIITDRMARVEVLVILALILQGTLGQGRAGVLAGTALIEVE